MICAVRIAVTFGLGDIETPFLMQDNNQLYSYHYRKTGENVKSSEFLFTQTEIISNSWTECEALYNGEELWLQQQLKFLRY